MKPAIFTLSRAGGASSGQEGAPKSLWPVCRELLRGFAERQPRSFQLAAVAVLRDLFDGTLRLIGNSRRRSPWVA
jgi:hypothetical protein